MKTKFTLMLALWACILSSNAQQVPNQSFDSWTIDTLAPDGWSTYESLFGVQLGLAGKDAADKVVGPYSLKITSDSVPGFPAYGVLSGTCGLGSVANTNQGPAFSGMAFPYRPDTLFVLYKYTSLNADTPLIALTLTAAGTSVFGGPYGAAFLFPSSSQWATGYIPLTQYYLNGTTPDTLGLQFYSSVDYSPGGGIKGSVLHVDGVLFGYVSLPSGLKEIADKLNVNLFPNPASDMITVSSDENADGYRMVISDINGKLVSANELSGQRTNISLTDLANGTYIYRIADKTGNILKQDRFNVVK